MTGAEKSGLPAAKPDYSQTSWHIQPLPSLILFSVRRSKKAIMSPGITGPVGHAGPVSEK